MKVWSRWIVEFNHLERCDIFDGIRKPKTPAAVVRPISDDMVTKLLTLKLQRQTHTYVRLALHQALRVHEIAKIAAEDFDLDAGWLMVTGQGGITKPIPIHPKIAKLAETMPGGLSPVQLRQLAATLVKALERAAWPADRDPNPGGVPASRT